MDAFVYENGPFKFTITEGERFEAYGLVSRPHVFWRQFAITYAACALHSFEQPGHHPELEAVV